MTLPATFFYEGMALVNRLSHDNILQSGTAKHMKMVAAWLRGQSCAIPGLAVFAGWLSVTHFPSPSFLPLQVTLGSASTEPGGG